MEKFLLTKKIGMTQVFDANGQVIPVTLLRASPLVVIDQKTEERDGYTAAVFGMGRRRDTHIAKAQRGVWGELGFFSMVREARGVGGKSRGDTVDLGQFSEGDHVRIASVSKGKGFQGVMKRHGFHGAPATHGTKHAHREPGSIGGGGGRAGGRVVKGMRMAGRMGTDRVTLLRVPIIKIDSERNIIAVRGPVPGRRGTVVEISA